MPRGIRGSCRFGRTMSVRPTKKMQETIEAIARARAVIEPYREHAPSSILLEAAYKGLAVMGHPVPEDDSWLTDA